MSPRLRLRCRCCCRSWCAANVGNFIKSFNFRRAQPTITAAATTKAIQQSKSSGGPGFLWQIKSALRKEGGGGGAGGRGAKAGCDLADCGKQLANKAKDNSSSNSSDSKRKQKQAEKEKERNPCGNLRHSSSNYNCVCAAGKKCNIFS